LLPLVKANFRSAAVVTKVANVMWVSLSEAPGTSEGGNSINKSTADQLYININLAEFMWWQ
jgi:hypothetical protein